MTELEASIDAPSEPQVHVPKESVFARDTNFNRLNKKSQTQINVIKPISQARFSVYLVNCRSTRQNYAMKVFPVEDGQTHPYFKNEIRFASFNHPNVIRTQYIQQTKQISSSQTSSDAISFILVEYAPYGDLFDFVTAHKGALDEKLIRTFFKQLIYGLEYIHSKNAAHLDIKLENLLLGENFMLKIADFDLSCFEEDEMILTKGTEFYRAPELMDPNCKSRATADIYSAGVVLFVLKSGGVLPHSERSLVNGVDLFELLNNNNEQFWSKHCEIQNKNSEYFDEDFRELFVKMTKVKPEERIKIDEIKASKWFKGPTYNQPELKKYIKSLIHSENN